MPPSWNQYAAVLPVLFILLTAPAAAAEPVWDARCRLTVEGAYLYGPVDGQLQTPSGGRPGTTSRGRPTLEELGIDDASVFDASMTFSFDDHEIYLGGQWVRFADDSVLDETLVSQANTFAAGSGVSSDVKLDWYRAGYRYRLASGDGPGGGPSLLLYPSAGAALLDFDFQLAGEGASAVSRAYSKVALQVGLAAEWRVTDRFSLAGGVLSSVPLSNTPFILAAELTGRYRIVQSRGMGVVGFAGVAYEQIHYEDNQDVSNDIEVDLGPMLKVGLEARF